MIASLQQSCQCHGDNSHQHLFPPAIKTSSAVRQWGNLYAHSSSLS
jgi:hypothetical protein